MGGSAEPKEEKQPIHPDSRAGGGGTGSFRDANSFLNDDSGSGTLRHARGAANRLLLAQAGAVPSSGGTAGTPKKNPPPRTKPYTKILAQMSNAVADIKVQVRVLADKRDDPGVGTGRAQTRITPTGGVNSHDGIDLTSKADGSIHKIKRKLVIRGSYVIVTAYGKNAKPDMKSQYGRGTTTADKANGDVTLGFHESCHQKEYLDYLLNTTFPDLNATTKMSASELVDAINEFESKFAKYHDELMALGELVDEVGYKKSTCQADGKCK